MNKEMTPQQVGALPHNQIVAAVSMLSYFITEDASNYTQINSWARRIVGLTEEILTKQLEEEFTIDG